MIMTSKQRILAAMRRKDVDHLPCSIYFNSNLQVDGYDLNNWQDRARLQIDLGTDPVINAGIPNTPHPDVKTRLWLEDVPGEKDQILFEEYQTPAGTLRMGIKYTDDWPSGMKIPWGDHSTSHMYEPLIKSPDDVDAFEYIWHPPGRANLASARKAHADVFEFAKSERLPLQGYAGCGLATLMFVMGAQNAVMFAIDHPEAFKKLAEIDSRTNIARIKLSAESGVDFVKRFGGYEQTNFYDPTIFREVIEPLLKKEVAVAHDAGIMIFYRVVSGMEPLLDDIASIGFDCIEGGEPHLSNCSLETWHDAFAEKACSWTGVSTPGLLGGNDPQAVRDEVRHCAEVFGNKGFILGVTNSIRNHFPWENTLAMIDEWKKVR
jgi:uroporphyrinogen-III decarboxylase